MSTISPNDRSRPVDIPFVRGRAHTRARSASESSEASTGMAVTPGKSSPSYSPPRIKIPTTPGVGGGVASSPVLSYFFPGSPTKAPTSMFGRTPGASASAVLEDDEDAPAILPASAHARRFSSSWAKPVPTAPPADDRGTGILRRFSLSSAFGKPVFSGTSATGNSPPTTSAPALPKPAPPSPRAPPGHTRIRRSATIAVPSQSSPRPPRAPSPMGERILKGHFDGFV